MPEFYRSRAAAEHANAEAAVLDNVRDRCERAEAAWTQMAERAERTQQQRQIREASAGSHATVSLADPVLAD
ncbi:hypothetical protein EAH79_10190 [Sphingomonas koreensis]|nr:hypothetical protein EAH87_09135 [Sphingomonas koreensis]TPG40632.1 hypothetical protein EAH79_10190 [Sphingomonas koreensis]